MDSKNQINKEIEIKLALSSFTDYLKLIGFLGQIEQEEHHTNIFFDTEDRQISKAGWALRVRADQKQGLVTIKSIGSKEGLAVIREEIESKISRSDAIDIMNDPDSIIDLELMPIEYLKKKVKLKENLKQLVKFENIRQKKLFRLGDYNYLLEIDKTSYNDGSTDYELEVELNNRDLLEVVEENLRKIFASLDISFTPQKKSKFHRALSKAGLL